MPEHVIAPAGKRHGVPDFIYADATARLAATGFIATDVTKFAWQQSDNTIWMLSDESPITWVQVGGAPVGGGPGSVTVAHLDADVPNSTATAAKITALDTPLDAGTYVFQYYIRFQVALTSTGVKFSANFTGTHSSFNAILRYVTAATTSVSDIADGDSDGVNGSLYQAWSRRAASNTANMGPTNGTDAANADCLWILEGLLVATGSGNIELYHASDAAAESTVKIGTSLTLIQTD